MASNTQKILVSQPKPTSEKSPYYDLEEKYGVNVVFRPFIRVDAISAKEFRAQRIHILDYTAIVFTARVAIDQFFALADELRIQIPEDMKYFCVTKSIAVYLQKYIVYRKRKIFFPSSARLEDLMIPIMKHNKESFLIPVSDVQHKDELFRLLDAKKIKYEMTVMFRTVGNDFAPDEPFDYDVLLFFSPSGIASLQRNFPHFQQKKIAIGTFGPTTAKAARQAGLRIDIEAPNSETKSMTDALENFLKAQKPKKK